MLEFDDRFVREVPGDLDETNVPRRVERACYTFVDPTPVRAPALLAASRELAAELGLALEDLARPPLLDALAGNDVLAGMRPFAACYGGHQFGAWAGQLGDGRAITLGELITPSGARAELQLKGAGPTPYSRRADGRAVLRSSLREFVCSEAMHHLGVPTTRALSLVSTGEAVLRDPFYDGRPAYEPGAIVARVAPSFLRFGSVQLFASRGEHELSKALIEHAIGAHFPELEGLAGEERYAALLFEVAERTAETIAHWMRVGFVHGVMNTDNMSLLGLTLDYGPFGFLEPFDARWTPNTTDLPGRRYAYGNQPRVGAFNVAKLAEAMAPLAPGVVSVEAAVERFAARFDEAHRRMLAEKLGFAALEPDDEPLVGALFALFESAEIDWTVFFKSLEEVPVAADAWEAPSTASIAGWLGSAHYDASALAGAHLAAAGDFLSAWAARSRREDERARLERMRRANPVYVPRNYLLKAASDALADGDSSLLEGLMEAITSPYEARPGLERYAAKRPEWARHSPGSSTLSCSS